MKVRQFLILGLMTVALLNISYSDSNGVWHRAEDIIGGSLGSDEINNRFTFLSNVTIDENIVDGDNSNYYVNPSDTSQIRVVSTDYLLDIQNPLFYINPAGISQISNLRARDFTDIDDSDFFLDPSNVSFFNELQGSIIRDKDDTSYYLDLNGGSRFDTIEVTNSFDTDEFCIDSLCYDSFEHMFSKNNVFERYFNLDRAESKLKNGSLYEDRYITFRDIWEDSTVGTINGYTTEWFELGYSSGFNAHDQKYSSIYATYGNDNNYPSYYTVDRPADRRNSADYFRHCRVTDKGVFVVDDISICNDYRNNGTKTVYHYTDETEPKGRVILELSLKSGRDPSNGYVCEDLDYLGIHSLYGNTGSPDNAKVLGTFSSNFEIPIRGACFGNSIDAKIMGRFVVLEDKVGDRDRLRDFYDNGDDAIFTFRQLTLKYIKLLS